MSDEKDKTISSSADDISLIGNIVYRPSFALLMKEYMSQGASIIEVCGKLGITLKTFEQFKKEHNDFNDAVEIGKIMCQSWWEKEGRISLRDNRFNNNLWYNNMKNRFKWADRQEQNIDVNGKMSISDVILDAESRVEYVDDYKTDKR